MEEKYRGRKPRNISYVNEFVKICNAKEQHIKVVFVTIENLLAMLAKKLVLGQQGYAETKKVVFAKNLITSGLGIHFKILPKILE